MENTTIRIDGRDDIYAVAFFTDGMHIVSGGDEKKVRRWCAQGGGEVGMPMDTTSCTAFRSDLPQSKWPLHRRYLCQRQFGHKQITCLV